MGLTTDPTSPCLGHGFDTKPVSQNACYLVLSDEERAKGFVRPVRDSYIHVGPPGPRFPTRALTDEERSRFTDREDTNPYIVFEPWPKDFKPGSIGRFWTQTQLDAINNGCGAITTMAREIAETYARDPHFYGATYCARCMMHRPVGVGGEFIWTNTNERVGA